jgi:hypothetical protein
MTHIQDRIEAARQTAGLSHSGLAEKAGIPRMTLSRRMVDPATFTIGELERIAAVLGTTVEALVFGQAA